MKFIVQTRDDLFHAVMVVSHVFSCSHTSCGRTQTRNRIKGGSQISQHLIGCAWDLVPDNYSGVASQLVTLFTEMGCYAVDEGDHVHVQLARRFLNAGEYIY